MGGLNVEGIVVVEVGPAALGVGPSERQHPLWVGREGSVWGRRTTKGVLQEDMEIRAFLQPMF